MLCGVLNEKSVFGWISEYALRPIAPRLLHRIDGGMNANLTNASLEMQLTKLCTLVKQRDRSYNEVLGDRVLFSL